MTATLVRLRECEDYRCADGVTMCAGCNGYGRVTLGGKRYKLRTGGRNIPDAAPDHTACQATGLAPCGCVELDAVTLAAITAAA